jgi:hypothetical protein
MDRPPSIYYTNKKQFNEPSVGRSNLSSSIQTKKSQKSSSLASRKYMDKKHIESERKIIHEPKKKLYHMKRRILLNRGKYTKSSSVNKRKSQKRRKKVSIIEELKSISKGKNKKKSLTHSNREISLKSNPKKYYIRMPKTKEKSTNRVLKSNSKEMIERTKQLIEKYSNKRKFSFSQPKVKNKVGDKVGKPKVSTNMNNVRNNRKLYKHSKKVSNNKSLKKKKKKYRAKLPLSVPKKKLRSKGKERRKKVRHIITSHKKINNKNEVKPKKIVRNMIKHTRLKNVTRNKTSIGAQPADQKQKTQMTLSKLNDNYKSENIYSKSPQIMNTESNGLPIITRKNPLQKNLKKKESSPTYSKEYVDSIRKYNLSMKKFRKNLIKNGFYIHSEHFSQSSNKSKRNNFYLNNNKFHPQRIQVNNGDGLASNNIQKSYSNVLYDKKNKPIADQKKKHSRKNYNSLYSDHQFLMSQKRSKSSNLNQFLALNNATPMNQFNPSDYIALKQKARDQSLNSTSKTFSNLRIKKKVFQNQSDFLELYKNNTHSSLPPLSNIIIHNRSSISSKKKLRVYKLDDNFMKHPNSKRFIKGKKIYSLGKNKYIHLNDQKKVYKPKQSSRFMTKKQKRRILLKELIGLKELTESKNKKILLPYTRNKSYIMSKEKELSENHKKKSRKSSINTQVLKELLTKLKKSEILKKKKQKVESQNNKILDVIDMSFKIVEENYKQNVEKMQVSI